MDAPASASVTAPARTQRLNRWLPFWAIFQADFTQTVRSWVFRGWVLLSLTAAVGCLLYRFGAYKVAGMTQTVSELMGELLHWTVLGSVTLIIILAGGSISSERGTMADSVLSRGISRHQYFLGKWLARLIAILGAFMVLGTVMLMLSFLLLRDDNLSLAGSFAALGTAAALLAIVISFGVAISAVVNSTVLGIAVLWLVLYGAGFLLSLMPADYPAPDRALRYLPNVLRGAYDGMVVLRLCVGAALVSLVVAIVGMVCFARRDV